MILPERIFNPYDIDASKADAVCGRNATLQKMAEDFPLNMLKAFYKDRNGRGDAINSVNSFAGAMFSISDPFDDGNEPTLLAIANNNIISNKTIAIIKSFEYPFFVLHAALDVSVHHHLISDDFVFDFAFKCLSRHDRLLSDVIYSLHQDVSEDHGEDKEINVIKRQLLDKFRSAQKALTTEIPRDIEQLSASSNTGLRP